MRLAVESASNKAFRVVARDAAGEEVGSLSVRFTRELDPGPDEWTDDKIRRPAPMVGGIWVDPDQRERGLGTRMYELAAVEACQRFRQPLSSSNNRTDRTERFWKELVAAGLAKCEPGIAHWNDGNGYTDGYVSLECQRYTLKTCQPTYDLTRGRRRG